MFVTYPKRPAGSEVKDSIVFKDYLIQAITLKQLHPDIFAREVEAPSVLDFFNISGTARND